MADPRMRPRFELLVPEPPQVVCERLRTALTDENTPVVGRQLRRHAQLQVRRGSRHFWSPQLNVDIIEHDDGTRIKGLFGPHPEVWTFFMSMYAVFSFIGFCGLLYGFSQIIIETPPTALLLLPGALVANAAVYGVGMVGRRLGEPQMAEQHTFLQAAVGARASETPVEESAA